MMAMARTLRIVMLSLVMLQFLIVENHATTTIEAPAPQPQGSNNHTMSVVRVALQDAQTHNTRSHVCFSAKSAALSACACLQAPTGTSNSVLAITTGRPREEAPNALELAHSL
ncbi:hypothetical protein ACE6H2_023472 [Prunus campanulata]